MKTSNLPIVRFVASKLKNRNAYQFFFLNLVVLTFISCKTIEVPEKWVFKETKYDYDKVVSDLNKVNYNPSKKDSVLKFYNTIINTNEQKIATIENVSITRKFVTQDSLNLEYFVFEPQQSKKVGLFFIGNTSTIPNFRNELITLAKQTNSKIYVPNYRGYGKTNGTPSFKTQFNDNASFLSMINKTEEKVDFVIGYSLGSAFATRLATENNISNLFLLAPFSNANAILAHQKKVFTKGPKIVFRPFIQLKPEAHLMQISNTEEIKKFKGNLVILHGTKDETLPFTMGVNLFENATTYSKKIVPLPNGNHSASFKAENWNILINEIRS